MKSDPKTHIRTHLKKLFEEYSEKELQSFSSFICQQLTNLIEEKNLQHIALFAPLHDEPDIWHLFERKDKRLKVKGIESCYFPRTTQGHSLEFVHITSKDQLQKGAYGILEPKAELSPVSDDVLDCILVPGVVFDEHGNRLGRGEGYYDRFLKQLPHHVLKIGVCFPFQLLHEVPTNEHDEKVDVVITSL